MSFTPTANTTFVGLQKPLTLAQLDSLATAGQLDLNTTYVDTATGNRYWATSTSTYVSSGDVFDAGNVNYVASGLLPPASGTIAAATLSAGVAYIGGVRVARAASAITLTATRDNYIDIRRDGTITVTPVTVAAAAPALAANSIRLGFCTTNASNVTSRTIGAFDSLGNWMYNVVPRPMCAVANLVAAGYGGPAITLAYSAADVFDNASIHDPVTNNTRFTLPANGAYSLDAVAVWYSSVTPTFAYELTPLLDGTAISGFPVAYAGAHPLNTLRLTGTFFGRAGQFLELRFNPNGGGGAIDQSNVTLVMLG